jgi:hypothetical protein
MSGGVQTEEHRAMKTFDRHLAARARTASRGALSLTIVVLLSAFAAVMAAAAASARADSAPSATAAADVVRPGGTNSLAGEGWYVGPRCEPRVTVSQREGHGFRVGSAPVRDNGTFSFSRRVPRSAARGARMVLDVTQMCDGVGTTRTVRFRIGKDRSDCPDPLSVAGSAHLVTVFGGLRCGRGFRAIGAFIETGSVPAGWDCANVDRKLAGHDYACVDVGRPGLRVIARRIRDV